MGRGLIFKVLCGGAIGAGILRTCGLYIPEPVTGWVIAIAPLIVALPAVVMALLLALWQYYLNQTD